MRSITKMLEDLASRVGTRHREEMGPLGKAVAHLNVAVYEGQKRQVKSPTLDAIAVVLDHVHQQREALEVAAAIALTLSSRPDEESLAWRALPDQLAFFGKYLTKCRMNQYVPPSDQGPVQEKGGTA